MFEIKVLTFALRPERSGDSHLLQVVATMAPKMKKPSMGMTIYFDQYNPNSEKGTDVRASLANLDYSPLKRVSGRVFAMAMLISMGGLV